MAEEDRLLEPDQSEAPTIPVPTDEPEPTPQPVAEAQEPEQKEDKDYRTQYENVRKALREERQSKADIQKHIGGMEERLRGYETLKGQLEEYRNSTKVSEDKTKYEEDPAGYLKDRVDGLAKQQEDFINGTHQANQELESQRQEIEFIRSQAQEYARQNPDYESAFKFTQDQRRSELNAMGIADEHHAQIMDAEAIQLARQAMQNGQNPAELLHNIAKVKGYSGPVAPDASTTAPTGNGARGNEASLQRLEEGQRAAATLSNGGQSDDSLLKSIERMTDDEFDKFWDSEVKPTYR